MNATIRKVTCGKIKAFADVEVIPGMKVFGFKVVEGSKGLWVSAPSRKTEKDGKVTYYDNIKLNDELKITLTKAVLEAYRA